MFYSKFDKYTNKTITQWFNNYSPMDFIYW